MQQDDPFSNQRLKQQKIEFDHLPKISASFLSSLGAREQGFRQANSVSTAVDLETYAEDELVRKEYKEMQCEMPGAPRSTFLMVFSPDGTKVASTHGNHNIYVTDLRTGKNIQTLSGHPRTPWCIAFHPTSNQIIASGCLGGQVRIWDLSGGSEVWTTETQTVIASLAFHPNERLLVIATYNELYFWDWSQPNPFLHTCTSNVKEKVRYVAFDTLGHKLITGIANTPQTRWERVRAPVPVPRQAERSASPYRRRITPRLVTNIAPPANNVPSGPSNERDWLAGIPERERRITVCYRNLVEQYELLVHRYLEIYRPATTIDRGTDPMEPYDQNRSNSNPSNTPGPSTSGLSSANNNDSTTPSTSGSTNLKSSNSRGNTTQSHNNKPLSNGSTQTGSNDSGTERISTSSGTGDPNAASSSGISHPSDSTSAPGPSGLGRFRTSKRPFPPKRDTGKAKSKAVDQKSCPMVDLSSDSSSSDDEPNVHLLKRRAVDNDNSANADSSPTSSSSGGGANLALRTNATYTATTQSEHQFTIAQSHRGPSGNVPPFPGPPTVRPSNMRKLYWPHSSAFSPLNRSLSDPNEEGSRSSRARKTSFPSTNSNPAHATDETRYLIDFQRFVSGSEPVRNPPRDSARTPPEPPAAAPSSSSSAATAAAAPTPTDSSIPSPLSRLRGISEGMLSSADELINFAERTNAAGAEPFEGEAAADFPAAAPPRQQNVYSDILSDLEYSLDNIRTMRINERTAATTGVLSSFAQGLESIMRQSDTILRNLRQSLDMLAERDFDLMENNREGRTTDARSSGGMGATAGVGLNRQRVSILRVQEGRMPPATRLTRQYVRMARANGIPYEEPNLFLRFRRNIWFPSDEYVPTDPRLRRRSRSSYSAPETEEVPENSDNSPTQPTDLSSPLPANSESSRNPIADHTYPRNPEAPGTLPSSPPDYIAPQVEHIEIIDRAMTEVSQLQVFRQMWRDLRAIMSNLSEGSRTVSSMRQMMAGTRISDSSQSPESPDPNPAEQPTGSAAAAPEADPATPAPSDQFAAASTPPGSFSADANGRGSIWRPYDPAPAASTSQGAASGGGGQAQQRSSSSSRKTYPPSRLCRLQRQSRRYQIINTRRRRSPFMRIERPSPRERPLPLFVRLSPREVPVDNSAISMEMLTIMVQRLEFLLAEQTRNIVTTPTTRRNDNSRIRLFCERIIADRLHTSRSRINRMLRNLLIERDLSQGTSVVNTDSASRMTSRLSLSAILDQLSRYLEEQTGAITPQMRTQMKIIVELGMLLVDIMLLQIVDSIPPPMGMSLDPEREGITARIDQICSRLLANRLSTHSQQLTRSLRLMRLTARYASRALGITYQARRHALLPPGGSSGRRVELLNQINNCLRHMHRRRGVPFTPIAFPAQPPEPTLTLPNPDMPTSEWCQSVRDLLTNFLQIRNMQNNANGGNNSSSNGSRNDSGAASPIGGGEESGGRTPPSRRTLAPEEPPSDSNYGPSSSSFGPPRNANREQPPASNNSRIFFHTSDSSVTFENLMNASSASSSRQQWNLPIVQVNDMPVSAESTVWYNNTINNTAWPRSHRIVQDIRAAANGMFRPRFLHPLYAGVNPFDADLDDPQREQTMGYDADMVTTMTPNHRIQVWDISNSSIPNISNPEKNIVVAECKIHNDASVDIAKDGTILVTLLPSGGYLNVTNRLGIYSLQWETLGQCLFTTNFEQNAVSVSLSPLSRHLIVGLASRRVSLMPTDRWTIARIFYLDQKQAYGAGLPLMREIDQNRGSNYMSVNCIRWMPASGQGLVYATNTGQLKVLS